MVCFCREFLEYDVSLPQDKVKEISEVAVSHINAAVIELRRLFLVEDLVDSIKFGVLLWCLTYVGSWFNGMTLIIIGKSGCLPNVWMSAYLFFYSVGSSFHPPQSVRSKQDTNRQELGDRSIQTGGDHFKVTNLPSSGPTLLLMLMFFFIG